MQETVKPKYGAIDNFPLNRNSTFMIVYFSHVIIPI